MKKILLLNIVLVTSVWVNAQKVIERPQIGMTSDANLHIRKIVLNETSTEMWFCCTGHQSIVIPTKTYLLPAGSNDTLFIRSAEGIPLNKSYPVPMLKELVYKLIFPRIDPSVKRIDYGEANVNGNIAWHISDILLIPDRFESILPENLSGNWFRRENGEWALSLLDSAAVYRGQVWEYTGYEEKAGIGKLTLKNGSKKLSLTIKQENNGGCLIGESSASLVNFTREPVEAVIPIDQGILKKPVFKSDTAIYCGYFHGLIPGYGQKTGSIFLLNIFSGKGNTFSFKIDKNGYFKVKIPVTHPQTVVSINPLGSETIFLEPGKTLFHYINDNLFMGENARINNDLQKIKEHCSYDLFVNSEKILDITPEQYRLEIEKNLKQSLVELKNFCNQHRISARANQLFTTSLNDLAASILINYRWDYGVAYYAKHSTPQAYTYPDSSYYSFLKGYVINPLSVMTKEYFALLEITRRNQMWIKNSASNWPLGVILEKFGETHALSTEEVELVKQDKEYKSDEIQNIQKEFGKKFGKQMSEFVNKHMNKLLPYLGSNRFATYAMQWDYLKSQKVELTKEDSLLFENIKTITETNAYKRYSQIWEAISSAKSKFKKERLDELNKFSAEQQISERNRELKKFGISSGLFVDLVNAQDFFNPLEQLMKPYSEQELKTYQQKIADPFIKGFMKVRNDEMKAKTEQALKNYKVNETPKTEPDKLFDAITARYRGKVIYMDFWATWCAPCRAGIEKIKPLKDEMSKENVVFVYITDQTSPLPVYSDMIHDIKGEHYRLSQDEWQTLSNKFGINGGSGIPRYVLVGKDGKVIDPNLDHLDNKSLKPLLMKYIKE